MKKIMLLCGAVILATPVVATANGLTTPKSELLIETVIDAKPIKREHPKYPQADARSGNEAWVELSFVVEPDGTVAYPLVENSSGGKRFEKSALRAIKKWQYKPAFSNGEAIQQCKTRVRLDFTLAGKPGARKKFIRKYKAIVGYINNNELEEANKSLIKLRKSKRWNLYEDAWYWLASSSYFAAKGNDDRELSSLVRIIGNRDDYLPKQTFSSVLTRVFILYIKSNRYAYALETFERMKKLDPDSEQIVKYQVYVDKINALDQSQQLISVAATLGEAEFWQHKLLRSSFGFNGIKGQLSKMDIRCQNKRSTYRISEQQTWDIPASWGHCTVYVYGEKDSEFKLVELPKQARDSST
ncbi:MAG: energy transducer TonB [Gammaproteobacteria bacterium]|nr:energy transducer TonB [Gammaproteobacteria bacterium]